MNSTLKTNYTIYQMATPMINKATYYKNKSIKLKKASKMNKKRSKIIKRIFLGLLAFSLTSCAINNEDIGTLTGGAVGGFLGNQIGGGSGRVVATVGGTLLGAFIGNRIGHTMDEVDKLELNKTITNVPSGDSNQWTNQHTHTHYTVTPGRFYQANNHTCRTYKMQASINGRSTFVTGVACEDSSGNWVTK